MDTDIRRQRMASNRRKYFRRTRKTRMRDLKHSPTGILSFCTAMAALAVFLTAVVQSFLASGEGGYKVGGLGLIGLILALGALLCGIFAVKEPKIRPLLPRLGIVFGAVLTVGLGGMYIFGLVG